MNLSALCTSEPLSYHGGPTVFRCRVIFAKRNPVVVNSSSSFGQTYVNNLKGLCYCFFFHLLKKFLIRNIGWSSSIIMVIDLLFMCLATLRPRIGQTMRIWCVNCDAIFVLEIISRCTIQRYT